MLCETSKVRASVRDGLCVALNVKGLSLCLNWALHRVEHQRLEAGFAPDFMSRWTSKVFERVHFGLCNMCNIKV